MLGLSAADTAAVLDTTVPAVNSALQRARVGVRAGAGGSSPVDRERVERYAAAIERRDVDMLTSLVAADVVLEMPPVPAWSAGVEPYSEFLTALFRRRGTNWSTRPMATAGGEPGLLLYAVEGGRRVPHTVQLFSANGSGVIGHVLVYRHDRLFSLFEDRSVPVR